MSAKYIERHTGIFTSRTFVFDGDAPSEAVLEKFKEIQEYMSVPPLFERVEADAQHVLDDSDATPESLADAERLLGLLESMRHIVEFQEMRIESCRKFSEYTDRPTAEELCETAINSVTVSMRDIAEVGYWIGMLHTQLCVRPHEPNAERGYRIIEAAKQGNAIVHGTTEEKQARWDGYQRQVDAIREANAAISHTEACRRVASQCGVHSNTVLNHVVKK